MHQKIDGFKQASGGFVRQECDDARTVVLNLDIVWELLQALENDAVHSGRVNRSENLFWFVLLHGPERSAFPLFHAKPIQDSVNQCKGYPAVNGPDTVSIQRFEQAWKHPYYLLAIRQYPWWE